MPAKQAFMNITMRIMLMVSLASAMLGCDCEPYQAKRTNGGSSAQKISVVMESNVVVSTLKIPPVCNRCGKAANVWALKGVASTTDPNDVVPFCEHCAVQGIRELSPCPHLVIVVASSAGVEEAKKIKRKYQVLQANPRSNFAEVCVIEDDSEAALHSIRRVRYDAMPEHYREIGDSFTIKGLALELELFEHSGSTLE